MEELSFTKWMWGGGDCLNKLIDEGVGATGTGNCRLVKKNR